MLGALTSAAEDKYHISASAPETVTLGRQFRVVFEINTRSGKFIPPDFSNFDILMGPSTSYIYPPAQDSGYVYHCSGKT